MEPQGRLALTGDAGTDRARTEGPDVPSNRYGLHEPASARLCAVTGP